VALLNPLPVYLSFLTWSSFGEIKRQKFLEQDLFHQGHWIEGPEVASLSDRVSPAYCSAREKSLAKATPNYTIN